MPGSFFSYAPLFLSAAGILLIMYDLIKTYREPVQEQPLSWYERPLLWFGGGSIAAGLTLWADIMLTALSDDSSALIYILSFFAISFLMVICFVIVLASSENKPETSRKRTRKARRALSKNIIVRENPLLTTMRMFLLVYAVLGLMAIWATCGLFFHPTSNQLFFGSGLLISGLLGAWCIHRH